MLELLIINKLSLCGVRVLSTERKLACSSVYSYSYVYLIEVLVHSHESTIRAPNLKADDENSYNVILARTVSACIRMLRIYIGSYVYIVM